MAGSVIRYDQMIDDALRSVVRTTLRRVGVSGLPGAHHLYISFRTHFPGVEVPDYLAKRYPEEMTIVLQYQFWDLEITEEAFTVTLSFNDVLERLHVPFASITSFADPAAQFGLQFKDSGVDLDEQDDSDDLFADDTPPPQPGNRGSAADAADLSEDGSEKVVALDKFRRK